MANKNRQNQLYLGIADTIISITATRNNWKFMADGPYRAFVQDGRCGRPDIALTVHYGSIPDFKLQKPIFVYERHAWSLYQSDRHYIFKSPSRLMVVNSKFSYGDIYVNRPSPIIFRRYPLQHPLDKILILNLLSKRKGTMIHACGISDNGEGILFVGPSRAGKSTMANLWKGKKDAIILSDDRIIIRKKNTIFWIYGTPWHGEAKVYSSKRAPLDKIFFLKHAKNNTFKKIDLFDVTLRLFACSLSTFLDRKIMEFTLNFCAELAGKVPCYELGFVPDESILDLIEKH